MNRYKLIDHTADIELCIFGNCLSDLFQNAGYALFDVITDIADVSHRKKRRFKLERDPVEELLVEWMNSLLYIFDTEQLLFSSFNVISIGNNELIAEAHGEFYNESLHIIKTGIKAVTYHNLKISGQNRVLEACVVLDI